MKIIGFQDIKKLNISPEICYKWVNDMIIKKSESVLPPKVHMNMPGNKFCNVMPCIVSNIHGIDIGGVKTVSRYPDRNPAVESNIYLFDAGTGESLAFMDGTWITAMRTGAVAAHSIILFAKKEYRTIGIIGAGNTARATILILACVVKDRPLNVKILKYKNQARLFIERFHEYDNIHFEIVDDVEQLVRGSDVVLSCATYFENDICSDDCFEKGVLVVPVHTRGFTNCDLFFDKIFADDVGHVDHFRNFSKFKRFAEVSDVLNGRAVGRENDSERILAYNIGVSLHDIYFATHIYNMLKTDEETFSKLLNIDLQGTIDKFWV